MRYISEQRINEFIENKYTELQNYFTFLNRNKGKYIRKKTLLNIFKETKNDEFILDTIYELDYMSTNGIKLEPLYPRKLQDIECYIFEILTMLSVRGID